MTALEAQLGPAVDFTPRRRTLRSVAAVVGGLLATVATTTVVDLALHATGVFPPMPARMSDALFVLALAYRIPFNVLGCVVAARLAVARPERHAYAVGAVGTVIATIGAIAMCEFGPTWYSLANIAVALPCAWLAVRFTRRYELTVPAGRRPAAEA